MEINRYTIRPLADLQEAYLRGADLRWADLQGANLRGADLQGADLQEADLREADLQGADLRGADLRWANLRGADLRGADLQGADLPDYQICPEKGGFIAFKKLKADIIAEIFIPASAKRISSLIGRKCRASKAKVLSLSNGKQQAYGWYNTAFLYKVEEYAIPDKFCDDIRIECSHGIHFFMTRKEAEEF